MFFFYYICKIAPLFSSLGSSSHGLVWSWLWPRSDARGYVFEHSWRMPLWLILLGSWPSRSQADKKLRWPGDFLKAVWERKMIDWPTTSPFFICTVKSCLQEWATSILIHCFSRVPSVEVDAINEGLDEHVLVLEDACIPEGWCRRLPFQVQTVLWARQRGKVASASQITVHGSIAFLAGER